MDTLNQEGRNQKGAAGGLLANQCKGPERRRRLRVLCTCPLVLLQLTGVSRCQQVPAGACRCLQVSAGVCRCLQYRVARVFSNKHPVPPDWPWPARPQGDGMGAAVSVPPGLATVAPWGESGMSSRGAGSSTCRANSARGGHRSRVCLQLEGGGNRQLCGARESARA